MFFFYNCILIFFSIIFSPYLIFKVITNERYRLGLKDRLVKPTPETVHKPIWIHASSVGEVKIAALLIRELLRQGNEQKIVLSVFTDTGMLTAKGALAESVPVFYLPIDLPWLANKAVQTICPSLFILIESEWWPNILFFMNKNKVPSLLVNGRISTRSHKHYKRFRYFVRLILNNISVFSMRSRLDADRILELGADSSRVFFTGNLKYDDVLENARRCNSERERTQVSIPDGIRIVMFGCTRDGEEEILIAVFIHLLSRYPDVMIIVAPRHINRVSNLEDLYKKHSLKTIRMSVMAINKYHGGARIVIVDSVGSLFSLYSFCTVAFVGGSLKPFGGHNVLEPAAFGKPVIFGSFMSNFQEEGRGIVNAAGGIQVTCPSQLVSAFDRLLTSDEQCEEMGKCAKEFVEKNAGSLKKTRELIEKVMDEQEECLF